jgi:hypothetical protein
MAVNRPLTSWPEYWMSTHCFCVTHSFIFHFIHCYFISLIKGSTLRHCAVARLVMSLLMVQVTWLQFPISFSNYHVCDGFRGSKMSFILSLHLLILFLLSSTFKNERSTQLNSQHVKTKVKLLLNNTFSECVTVSFIGSFHILMQSWLYV